MAASEAGSSYSTGGSGEAAAVALAVSVFVFVFCTHASSVDPAILTLQSRPMTAPNVTAQLLQYQQQILLTMSAPRPNPLSPELPFCHKLLHTSCGGWIPTWLRSTEVKARAV